MSDVPATWATAPLAEICYRIVDGSHNPPKGTGDGNPMLSARNISDGKIVFDEFRWISDEDFAAEDARTRVKPGDVLLTIVGTIGRTAVVPESAKPFALQRSVAVLKPTTVASRYLAYCLESPIQQQWLLDNAKGTAQKGVYLKTLGSARIPIAPTKEQTRIVEKLEELLSDLDAGVVELKAAQRKLVQYRQSLLKAAVEGALTADWRASRARSGEPQETGADLLQSILTERRARWEAKQLAKYTEQGKTPPKGWEARYPEPNSISAEELPSLSDGWVWSTLDQLSELITSGSRGWADYYASEGATFIRSQNINKDFLDLTDIAYVNPPRKSEGARTLVQRGDVLLTITGANVGKAAWVDIDLDEAYVSQHVALIRPVELNLGNYLQLFLTSRSGGRGQLDREAYGAGKPGLNLEQVAAVAVPLPSLLELAALMERVEEQIVAASTQYDAIEHGLRQAAAQRKNILKAAFAGQLVPQDPTDEPASALLERIRAERASLTGTVKPRGRKPRTTA